MRTIVIILVLVLLSLNTNGQGWNSNAYPAAIKSDVPATLVTQSVVAITGSTSVSNGSTEWHFNKTNLTVVGLRWFQPTNGVREAFARVEKTYVKTALPPLPQNIIITNLCLTNFCIRAAVSNECIGGGVTNHCLITALTNTISGTSRTLSNYYYKAPASTNSTLSLSTNDCYVPAISNMCVAGSTTNWCTSEAVSNQVVTTNTTVSVNIDPCSVVSIITNVVIETNGYYSVACATNPGLVAAFSWSNNTSVFNCLLTNVPQLITTTYAQLINTNADGATTNHPSHFWPSTNANLQIQGVWDWDDAEAAYEKLFILTNNPNPPFRRFGFDIHDTVTKNAPYWKDWVISNAFQFVISSFTNSAGTFDDYCASPQTGMVWTSGQSGLCSNPVMDSYGNWYCRSPLYNTTNQWVPSISYRPPPQWSDTLYLDSKTNLTSVSPYQFSLPLNMAGKLCKALGLPMDVMDIIVTNIGTFDGWRVGLPYVHTTNTSQIVTLRVPVSTYFDYTPDLHGATRGHLVTNTWALRNLWLTWGSGSSLSNVVTNTLGIAGNTQINISSQYWSNGWRSAGICFSNSALYTLQITGYTNWTTVSTNRFYPGFDVPSNCSSNLITTNQISGGVTNTLTNIVLTCWYTNTASTVLNVKSIDWQGSIQYTNFIDYGTFTNTNAVAYINWSSSNVTSLLSVTLTNAINTTNIISVFTNWNVAKGQVERDYEYDGLKACLNAMTKILKALAWKNQNGVLANRYGTNYVHDIADTNLFGSLRPTSVVTDTLANASAAIHFTNLNYSANVPPWGASFATATNTGVYAKDNWQGSILQSSWPDDGSVVVYTCNSYTVRMVIPGFYGMCSCDSYSTNILTCDNVSEVVDLANAALGKEVTAVSAATGGFGSPSYVYIVLQDNPANMGCDYCNQPWGKALGKFDFYDCNPTNYGTFYMTNNFCGPGYPAVLPTELPADYPSSFCAQPVWCPTPSSYVFWHGSSPSNFSFCCEQDSVFYSGSASWTNVGAFTDSGTIAYSVGTPTATNALAIYLAQPQQSSAGVLADISKSWACGRDVYLLPNLPTITAAGWINTNILPVAASINSNATVLVTWTNTLTGDCANKFAESMPQQWTYDAKAGFYQSGSNVTQVVTNFQWETTAVWKSPSVWAAAWDSTNNVGFYRRFSAATEQTNTFGLLDFLSTTPLIPNVEDGTSYGWGVGSGILIEDWSVSGGLPHQ